MSELPKGWVETKISDLCELVNGKAFKPSDWAKSGLPIVRIQNLNNPSADFNFYQGGVEEKFLISAGQLLFAWSGTPGTSFGAHVWNGGNAVLNQHIFKVNFPNGLIDKHYLKNAINQRLEELIGKAHGGAGLQHVTKGKFEETLVVLPPLAEQKRIVAKLDALNARSARARTELARIETLVSRYKQAVLGKAFAECNGRMMRLGELIMANAPIRYGVLQPGSIKDVGVPLVRVCDLVSNRVSWEQLRRIDPSIDNQFSNARIQNGDVLVSVVGTIGRVALVEGMTEPTNIARAVARLRPDRTMVRPEWLALRLQSSDCQQTFSGDAREVARKTLNVSMIRAVSVAVPSLAEQHEIVRRIESAFARIDRLAAQAKRALELVGKLDEAILAKAFRGELVPQNDSDEPAEKLLERIRAERAAAPKVKRGRGRGSNLDG